MRFDLSIAGHFIPIGQSAMSIWLWLNECLNGLNP